MAIWAACRHTPTARLALTIKISNWPIPRERGSVFLCLGVTPQPKTILSACPGV